MRVTQEYGAALGYQLVLARIMSSLLLLLLLPIIVAAGALEWPPAAAAAQLKAGAKTPVVARGPTNNTDLSGTSINHTYTKHANKTAGALDCQATCDADPLCRAWVYVPYGDAKTGPESLERCCIKGNLCCVTRGFSCQVS